MLSKHIRQWLIEWLAGDAGVVGNITISGNSFSAEFPPGAIIFNLRFNLTVVEPEEDADGWVVVNEAAQDKED